MTPSDWEEAAAAACEVIASSVGASGAPAVSRREGLPAQSGAFIPLAGPRLAVQLGLTGTEAACRRLAAGLLQCSEAEAAGLSPAEVADGVCEIVNIAAGHVKARLSEAYPGIALGLPLFVHGGVQPGDRMQVETFDAVIEDVPCVLALLHRRE